MWKKHTGKKDGWGRDTNSEFWNKAVRMSECFKPLKPAQRTFTAGRGRGEIHKRGEAKKHIVSG